MSTKLSTNWRAALLVGALLAGCSNSDNNQVSVASSATVNPPAATANRLVVAQNGQLVSLDANGQNPLVLTKGSQDSDPNFRPDGSDLIFTRPTATGRISIFRMQPDGSNVVEVTPNFASSAYDPDYSFDGSTIVFSANGDIYRMNADGSGITQITEGPDVDRHPDLSPDGRTLAFQRNHRIVTTGANGGQVADLAVGTFPAYASSGELIFSRGDDLWSIDEDSEDRLTQTAHVREFDPQIGSDGTVYSIGSTSHPTAGEVYSSGRQLTTSVSASRLAVASSVQVAGSPNKFTANAPYARSFSPFTHGIGVCYGLFNGRNGNVQTDMTTLTQTDGFKSLHLYRLFSEGSLTPDPQMQQVMQYAAAQSPKIEILLGTLNSEVTGILSTPSGATQYVAALKPYLDTGVIKVIGLGNEPNDKGQANLAPGVWTTAAQNLRAALTAAGYDTPISACLLFGGITSYPPASARFQDSNTTYSMLGYMQAINSVNPGRPFVFVNILPSFTVNDVVAQNPQTRPWYPDFGLFKSTTNPASNDGNLAPYWCLADLQYNCVLTALRAANLSNVQVYISESGWPSANGGEFGTPQNEAAYVNGLLNQWIRPQMLSGGTVPTFLFEGYDEPSQGGNSNWGLRDVSGNLKPGITLPSFISE